MGINTVERGGSTSAAPTTTKNTSTSTPTGTKSYVVYDPKTGKQVIANMTSAQVAAANKMGINTVERGSSAAPASGDGG